MDTVHRRNHRIRTGRCASPIKLHARTADVRLHDPPYGKQWPLTALTNGRPAVLMLRLDLHVCCLRGLGELRDILLDESLEFLRRAAEGVAANGAVRAALQKLAADNGLPFVAPPLWLCTDNAAMVAWTGAERLARGWTDGLDLAARARWPLDPEAAPALGFGRLGAQA